MAQWRFYGRNECRKRIVEILQNQQFFFLKIEGRRRIGKSRLVLQSLEDARLLSRSFRLQIPDAEPGGLIASVREALSIFKPHGIPELSITSLWDVARLIQELIRAEYIIVLDEFQYLNRERLRPLLSYLQEVVDQAKFTRATRSGGLIVAGSIHTEMQAILESKDAPLYGRITDRIELNHFTPATIKNILSDHSTYTPEKLLFFYTLLEGVPKYYEDVFERQLFHNSRHEVLKGLFFDSSAPLANEAETWFLHGLKGRYITILRALAQNNGYATHHQIQDFITHSSGSDADKNQVGAYLEILKSRYKLLAKQQPIFTKIKSRHTRYAIQDNFLLAWLHAISPSFRARGYRPMVQLLDDVNTSLIRLEGLVFEKLVRNLIRQRSREGLLDFNLTQDIEGYWNDKELEIDLILIDDLNRRVCFGSCKRQGSKLLKEVDFLPQKVSQLLKRKPFQQFFNWTHDYILVAPEVPLEVHRHIVERKKSGVISALGMDDLIKDTGSE